MPIRLDTPFASPRRLNSATLWTRIFAAIGILLLLERAATGYLWTHRPANERSFSAISSLGIKFPFSTSNYTDPADQASVSKSLIVASIKKEHTNWINKNFPDWQINTYIADSNEANYTVFKNDGREASVYLTYIINHYSNLPDYMVFIHAQRYQWHNDDPMFDGIGPIKNLQLDNVDREGYVSLRCNHETGCPVGLRPQPHVEDDLFGYANAYARVFQDFFPKRKVPPVVSAPCCSQFAVSKKTVLARPARDYEQYREFLWHNNLGDGKSGRIMEYMWHLIFSKPPIYCPSADQCYCKNFGLCDLKCPNAPKYCLGRYIYVPFFSPLNPKWPKEGQGVAGYPKDGWWKKFYPTSEYDGFSLRANATRSSSTASTASTASPIPEIDFDRVSKEHPEVPEVAGGRPDTDPPIPPVKAGAQRPASPPASKDPEPDTAPDRLGSALKEVADSQKLPRNRQNPPKAGQRQPAGFTAGQGSSPGTDEKWPDVAGKPKNPPPASDGSGSRLEKGPPGSNPRPAAGPKADGHPPSPHRPPPAAVNNG